MMVHVGVFVRNLGSTKDWTQQHSKRSVKLAVPGRRKAGDSSTKLESTGFVQLVPLACMEL